MTSQVPQPICYFQVSWEIWWLVTHLKVDVAEPRSEVSGGQQEGGGRHQSNLWV